jgi:hypothetical protein
MGKSESRTNQGRGAAFLSIRRRCQSVFDLINHLSTLLPALVAISMPLSCRIPESQARMVGMCPAKE